MKEIEILIKLQELDSRIYKIKAELKESPEQIYRHEKIFNEKTQVVKKLEDELKKNQLKHKEKELELGSREDNIKKQKTQLFQVKSNKEYNTLQMEIEKIKADNSILEEQIIIILEEIDKVKGLLNAEKEKLALEEKKFKEEKAKIELRVKELNQEIDALNCQRKQVIGAGIKKDVMALYERILENKGEFAIVQVKNDSCSGCCMSIRPQTVNELRLGKLVTCESCARILYVEDVKVDG